MFSSLALSPSSLLTFLLGKLFGLILGKDQLLGKWAFFSPKKLIIFSGKASLAHIAFSSASKKFQLSNLEFELFSMCLDSLLTPHACKCYRPGWMRFGATWSREGVPVHGRRVELDDLYCPFQPNHSRILQALHSLTGAGQRDPWQRTLEVWINLLCYHCSPSKLGLSGDIPEVSVRLEM